MTPRRPPQDDEWFEDRDACPTIRVSSGLITADASKVSPAEFMDAIFGKSDFRERVRAECKRAILRGDTYGYPPLMVADIRTEMEADDLPTELKRTGTGGWL